MYAIKSPDGTQIHRVIREPLPNGSTDYAAFGVWEAHEEVPAYDPQTHRHAFTGWELVNGVVVRQSVLIPIEPEIPWAISNADLRRALVAAGINPKLITQYIQAMEEGAAKWAAEADWEYANYFERSHPLLDQLAPAFGLTSQQVDEMFRSKPAYPPH